jgi:hypothetical protein
MVSADWFDWTANTLAFSLLIGSFLLIAVLIAFKRKQY